MWGSGPIDHLNGSTGILQARIISLVVEPMVMGANARMAVASHHEEIDPSLSTASAITLSGCPGASAALTDRYSERREA
jgi:hypothetical protein